MPPAPTQKLLEVRNLSTHIVTKWGTVRAVDQVSFAVGAGETLGLVGESGSGKSMTCLSILRLTPKAAHAAGGQVLLEGEDLLALPSAEMTRIRGKKIAMILQDPMSSLNPVLTIGKQVEEPVAIHQGLGGGALKRRAIELLAAVGIPSPEARLGNYPHQMSGGMRQRAVGAMAIAAPPRVLIADEPTTSLDVTIQAQYLRLLRELQAKHDLAMIFVTHDLGIVAKMCERVAIMYAGRIVETGPTRRIWRTPAHPYTQALLGSVPAVGVARRRLTAIDGQPPDAAAMPTGCAFHPRCPHALPRCAVEAPPEIAVAPDQTARCWLIVPTAAATVVAAEMPRDAPAPDSPVPGAPIP